MYADLRQRPTVTSCKHAKVYSGESLGTFYDIPTFHGEPCVSWYWICSTCLSVGTEMIGVGERPQTEASGYWSLMRTRDPKCWVPGRYRN